MLSNQVLVKIYKGSSMKLYKNDELQIISLYILVYKRKMDFQRKNKNYISAK